MLGLCVAPLVAIAALGMRRPGPSLAEQALVLWIPAVFVVYFVNDAYATHALEAIGVPFGVLAVRAGDRLRLRPVVAAAAVALLTVPVAAYEARKFVRTAQSPLVQYVTPRADAGALRWVAGRAPRGGVLAPMPFAATVPELTGRAVWVGDAYWTPHYAARVGRGPAAVRRRPVTGRGAGAGAGQRRAAANQRLRPSGRPATRPRAVGHRDPALRVRPGRGDRPPPRSAALADDLGDDLRQLAALPGDRRAPGLVALQAGLRGSPARRRSRPRADGRDQGRPRRRPRRRARAIDPSC